MMRAVVIGASGQVGEHLFSALEASGYQIWGTYYLHPFDELVKLNIEDRSRTMRLICDFNPTVIFLPASLTNVDYCEHNPEEGYKTNVVGTKNVVAAANQVGAKLVFFSTDYIFDGRNGPYRESDPANPICEYGRQKLIAEHFISLCAQNFVIVRTTVVYGWERQGKNFVSRLIRSLQAEQVVRVPDDQIGSPTYAPDLARACVELVERDARGVFNVAGRDRTSRYQFALEVARIFNLDADLVQPVATSKLGQGASRPLNAGFVVEKAEQALGRELLGYRKGLQRMAQELQRKAQDGRV